MKVLVAPAQTRKQTNNLVDVQVVTDPVENFGPSLHGDTLEDCKHGKADVIKVGDAIVGTLPAWPTLRAVDHAAASVTSLSTG